MPILTERGRRAAGIPRDPTVPDAPVLNGNPANGATHISWTVPADNGAGISGYKVFRDSVLVSQPGPGVTSFDDTGLTNGTSYTYRVSATNSAGDSILSNMVTLVPVAAVPSAPVLSGNAGSGSTSISWTAPANNGATITTYRVYRDAVFLTSVTAPTLSLVDSTVSNGVSYSYRVAAVNSAGEGSQSNAVSLTPVASGAPTLPANALVGQASWRAISWGSFYFALQSVATFNAWESWGFYGSTSQNPAQYVVDSINGSGQLISETPNTPGSSYDWQRAQEGRGVASVNGGSANLGAFNYRDTDPSYEAYLKFYLAPASHPSTYPAMFDWWDDAAWTTAATWFALLARDLKNNLGGSGCAFDPEPGSWTVLGPGRTRAEQDQKVHDRAYQCGQAYFEAWPDAKVFVYQFDHPGGYQNVLNYYAGGDTRPVPASFQGSWMLGFLKAMCDFGSVNSRFMAMDSPFYTWGEGGAGGPSVDARSGKLKLNCERGMACMSQPYPMGVGAASWSDGCDRIRFIPAAWPGPSAGGRATPNSTVPAQWGPQELVDREWSMGEWRCVYHGPSDAAAGGQSGVPNGQWYNTPAGGGTVYGHGTTHLAGNQAAADPAPLTTRVLPTCTSLSWTGSTLTCHAAHYHGVAYVKVYNGTGFNPADPEPSYLGAMSMDWGHPSLPDYVGTPAKNGGNASGSYPTAARVADSYQDCTFTRAGASGAWLVVKVVSSKFDVAWFKVQHP